MDRTRLWQLLADSGMDQGLISLLRSLFDHNTSRVEVNGARSEPLSHDRGLLQGSILSPWLYAVSINPLLKKLRAKATWTMGSVPVVAFVYADDIALLADDIEHLRELLAVCEEFAAERGFRFAPRKCEVIAPANVDTSTLCLHGQALTRTDGFVYLGIPMSLSGIDVRAWVQRVSIRMRATVGLLLAAGLTARSANAIIALHAFTTFVRPQLEYCLQLAPITTRAVNRLEKLQREALKVLLCIAPSTYTPLVYQLTGLPTMHMRAVELGARWVLRLRAHEGDLDFMIQTAIAEREANPTDARSCLAVSDDVIALADTLAPLPRSEWREAIKARRLQTLTGIWQADDRLRFCTPPEPGLCLRQISTVYDRPLAHLLLRLAANRFVGAPEPCVRCGPSTLVTPSHFVACTGVDPRLYVASGDLRRAAMTLLSSSQTCLPRRTTHLIASARAAFDGDPRAIAHRARRHNACLSETQRWMQELTACIAEEQRRVLSIRAGTLLVGPAVYVPPHAAPVASVAPLYVGFDEDL